MNYAYVTLLSSTDYLKAVLVLNRNLKQLKCRFPLCVMVTENVYEEVISYLLAENILVRKVPVITYSPETLEKLEDRRLRSIASKVDVFLLSEFDKIVYLDVDSLFFKCIDELFEYHDGAMYDDESGGYGFCGLFVCTPKTHILEHYLAILQNSYMWESDLIEGLWFPFIENEEYHILFNYFISFTIDDLDILKQERMHFIGIHFISKYKPWLYSSSQEFFNAYTQEFKYDSEKERIIQLYLNEYIEPLKKDYPNLFEDKEATA